MMGRRGVNWHGSSLILCAGLRRTGSDGIQTRRLAIGPWHAKMHVAACQDKYGARSLEGTGRTFGDNIEHLWSELRKFGSILKYMSNAPRQDYLTQLIQYREQAKDLRQASQLKRWHADAVLRGKAFQVQLDVWESDLAAQSSSSAADAGVPVGNDSQAEAHALQPPDKLDWRHEYHALLAESLALNLPLAAIGQPSTAAV
ncbi:hypothetical protein WJX72_005982 [[Myrmecia] bisecta]|uniref:Uncharacterized protein n=1 Tax=[Myrmecia] bisecta TaxID=41462 RepID=A0AAW1QAM8_9CHLO